MGLYHSFSAENQLVSQALQIVRTTNQIGVHQGLPVYEHHRIATKEYKYIGMDYATARACADYLRQKYVRQFTQAYNSAGVYKPAVVTVVGASVDCVHDDAASWHVDISVSEDQCQYTPTGVSPQFDEGVDYDEVPIEGVYLNILEIEASDSTTVVHVHYGQAIEGFSRSDTRFKAETAADTDGQWTEITPTAASSDGDLVFAAESVSAYVRLSWDGSYSNVAKVPDNHFTETVTIRSVEFDGVWRLSYDADFPNFTTDEVFVQQRDYGADSWNNITDECTIDASTIVTNLDDQDGDYEFRVVYDTTASDVVATPYDWERDTGDGSVVVTGCYYPTGQGVSTYNVKIVTSAASENITMKWSSDGRRWWGKTISIEDISGNAKEVHFAPVGNDDQTFYYKFFVSDVQASGVIKVPYNQEVALGLMGIDSGNDELRAFYVQHIGGFWEESPDFKLQISEDGGETWDDCVLYEETMKYVSTDFRPNGAEDVDPCLFRLVYRTWISDVFKYPQA